MMQTEALGWLKKSFKLPSTCYGSKIIIRYLSKMRQRHLSDGKNIEPNLKQQFVVEDVSPVKDKCRLNHGVIDFLVIKISVYIPFRHNSYAIAVSDGFVGIVNVA